MTQHTFWGSSWTRVLTTSTGVRAACVMEQQIPPAAAPLRKYMPSYLLKSYFEEGAKRTAPVGAEAADMFIYYLVVVVARYVCCNKIVWKHEYDCFWRNSTKLFVWPRKHAMPKVENAQVDCWKNLMDSRILFFYQPGSMTIGCLGDHELTWICLPTSAPRKVQVQRFLGEVFAAEKIRTLIHSIQFSRLRGESWNIEDFWVQSRIMSTKGIRINVLVEMRHRSRCVWIFLFQKVRDKIRLDGPGQVDSVLAGTKTREIKSHSKSHSRKATLEKPLEIGRRNRKSSQKADTYHVPSLIPIQRKEYIGTAHS